eukprot:GEMP01009949.1.p1 GENE.GEMP01009949.1~~GEMP01009949.1.p1  ORF type:complete len:386 (+),score=61.83 GEMP01009949.1:464-1621(+)
MDFNFNLNIAMCHMKMGDFDDAIKMCEKALNRRHMIPDSLLIKCLYRQADAQWQLQRLDHCLETLKQLLEVDPQNKAALQLQQTVDRIWSKQCREQKNNFKKLFSEFNDENVLLEKEAHQKRTETIEHCGFSLEQDETHLKIRRFDRDQWGAQLIDTVLYSVIEFALQDLDSAPLTKHSEECTIWFLGASSTFELRIIQLETVLKQLPHMKTIKIVLLGFQGDIGSANKPIPDTNKPEKDGLYAEATDGDRVARMECYSGSAQDIIDNHQLESPTIAVIAHPHFNRYFSPWHPPIQWLIQQKTPTLVIGGSEPDYSEKEGEKILEAYGCNLRLRMTRNPYLISLVENDKVSKLHHFFLFKGGPGLDKANLTRTKLNLLAADYHIF